MNKLDLTKLTQMSIKELEMEKKNIESKIINMIILNPDELEKLDVINDLLERSVKWVD